MQYIGDADLAPVERDHIAGRLIEIGQAVEPLLRPAAPKWTFKARKCSVGRAMASNPHDALFKRVFSDVTHAAGEFRAVLPSEIVAEIDFATLAVCPGSFVDESLRERHTDLLYSVRLRERDAFLYLLFEHQSTVDALMPYRVLGYVVRIWEGWLRDQPEARRLPAVLPVVLHHSESGWTGSTRLLELIDLSPEVLERTRPYLPDVGFLLDDLSKQTDEALYARAMTTLSRLVLWSLRTARGGRLAAGTFATWGRAFRELGEAPSGREALETILRYLVEVLGEDRTDVIDAILAEDVGEHVREAYVTLHHRFIEEGRKEGLKEGLKEGERAVLLKLIKLKFGPPAAATVERIQAADSLQLGRWAERILSATSIDDLWD